MNLQERQDYLEDEIRKTTKQLEEYVDPCDHPDYETLAVRKLVYQARLDEFLIYNKIHINAVNVLQGILFMALFDEQHGNEFLPEPLFNKFKNVLREN